MPGLEVKSFDSPDEVRPFEGHGQTEIVNIAGHMVGKGTFEPGWKWSEHVKPIAGTDSCQTVHLGYVVSGRSPAIRRRASRVAARARSRARSRSRASATGRVGPNRSARSSRRREAA